LNTNFPFKKVHFVEVRVLTSSLYILYDYTTSGNKVAIEYICNVYIYIQYTYISIQCFIHLWCMKNVRLISYNFATVHSDRTVVVSLHKHLLFRPSPFINSAALSRIVSMLL